MTSTYFIATVLGWYMVVMAILLLYRRHVVTAVMSDIMAQPGLLFVIAFLTFLIGLLIVASHNLWVMGWPVLITILGWITLISGIIRLFCPETIRKMWARMNSKPNAFTISAVIVLLIGLFLLYKVYLG